ncbi:MAG TPA: DUF945 family protein [Alcanivorax sp.]|nr:DUF945 family protein [Alcanivorax sp.]
MKKLLLAVLVLGGLWLAAGYVIGNKVEDTVRAQVAAQEFVLGSGRVRLEVVDYDKGLFGAQSRICVVFDRLAPPMAMMQAYSGKLCDRGEVHYGPLLFGPGGPSLGLAYARSELDLSPLPPEIKQMVDGLFDGRPPVIGHSWYTFDGGVDLRVLVSPFRFESPELSASLAELRMDGRIDDPAAKLGDFFVRGRDLRVTGPRGALVLPELDAEVRLKAILGDVLPMLDMTMALNGLSVSAGGREQVAGNVTLRTRTREDGDTLSGDSGLWLDALSGDQVPERVDSAWLGVDWHGFDRAATIRVQRLSRELDNLQLEMMMQAMSGDGDSAALQEKAERMAALGEEMITVMTTQLLHPGRTGMTVRMVVDGTGERQLTLDSALDYNGLDGLNPSFAELQMLPPPALARLADLRLDFDAAVALLPPGLRASLVDYQSSGWLRHDNGRLHTNLTIEQGQVTLNGESMTVPELLNKGQAAAASGTDPALELDADRGAY